MTIERKMKEFDDSFCWESQSANDWETTEKVKSFLRQALEEQEKRLRLSKKDVYQKILEHDKWIWSDKAYRILAESICQLQGEK